MNQLILVGAGEFCRNVIDTLLFSCKTPFLIQGITDNILKTGELLKNLPVLGSDADAEYFFDTLGNQAFIAIGSVKSSNVRKYLYEYYQNIGYHFPVIIDSSAILSNATLLGNGTYVGKGAIINNDVTIGENCIINTGSVVEHDVILENHVHICPRTTLCGGVQVGMNSHIGAGSTVLQGVHIGKDVTIGIGSVVLEDIPDGVIAFGNPCKVKRRNENGDNHCRSLCES